MRTRLLAPILPLALAARLAFAAGPADVPAFAKDLPKIETGEPILSFNGKDLTGFYTYTKTNGYSDPQKVFTVQDGLIRVSGEDYGAVTTCGNYRNYHLIVEWKWGTKTWGKRAEKTRDSGILLHCVGPDGAAGGQWMQSQECQIIEGGCGDFIMVGGKLADETRKSTLSCEVRTDANNQLCYEKGGEKVTKDGGRYNWWGRDPKWKDELGFRGARDVESPTGEWNRMEVVCDGDTITNIVNGYVVNVGTGSSLTEGKLQFQSEGAEIFFRKIEIRPLKPKAKG